MTDEKDYLLDHEYDGIQEYDNPLPGWWVWLFIVTIVVVPLYVLYYHWGTGPSVHDEYDLSMAAFFEEQAKQFEGMEISEASLWKLMQNQDMLTGMRKRFEQKCATCHKADASGDTCPNLTDEYWKHGGDLMQIYTTILNGVKGTEMKSWKNELGPSVMMMAAYIGSLRGTNVAGEEPEGDKYVIKVPEMPSEAEKDAEKKDAGGAGDKAKK